MIGRQSESREQLDIKDDIFHGGADRLEVFELRVDWATPGNSTFTRTDSINVTPYTYTVCGFFNFNCVRQPLAIQRVDAVSEWPMWPLAYRNFGDHQTLVANFTVDVGGDRAGIRWYELRKSGGGWAVYQEGTHAPGGQMHVLVYGRVLHLAGHAVAHPDRQLQGAGMLVMARRKGRRSSGRPSADPSCPSRT